MNPDLPDKVFEVHFHRKTVTVNNFEFPHKIRRRLSSRAHIAVGHVPTVPASRW